MTKKKEKEKAEIAGEETAKKGSKPAPDIIIKDKFVKRSVAGLVFWPGKEIKTYKGVLAWVEAKMPDNAYIYDTLDNLVTCGVPLRDVQLVNGTAIKIKPRKPIPAQVNIAYAVPSKAPEVKKTIDVIQDADTKTHHQMSYG